MMSRSKICFTIMLLFVMGVQKCHPLKCFNCSYTVLNEGGKTFGHKECKDVKESDTGSKLLVTCPKKLISCVIGKGGVGVIGGVKVKSQIRRGCDQHHHDKPMETKVHGYTWNTRFCQKDACNRSVRVGPSCVIPMLVLSLICVLTRASRYLS